MGLWGTLCLLIFLGKTWGQEETCIISAPMVFRLGLSGNITVQTHGHTDAFDATISVKSYPDANVWYSSDSVHLSPENEFQNSTVLTIPANQLSEGQNLFSYVNVEVVSKHFSNSEKVPVIYGSDSLFVHTDKHVYMPQQFVKVGVSSLDDELKPVTRETLLTLIDPEGSEVLTMAGKNDTGIVDFPDFQIPSNPKYGRWTINAKYRDEASRHGTAQFDVREHDKAYKAALTPVSDVQHHGQIQEDAQGLISRTTYDLQQKITEKASTYKHAVIKKCCYDGASRREYESCEQRASRVKIGPNCVRAFTECCAMANEIRGSNTFKTIDIGRSGDKYGTSMRTSENLGYEIRTAVLRNKRVHQCQMLLRGV